MEKSFDYLPASDTVRAFINDFIDYRKNVNRDPKRAVEGYLEILRYDRRKPNVSNIVEFTSKRYSTEKFVSYVNDLVDRFGFDRNKIYNDFQEYREKIIRSDDPIKYKNIIQQKYPDLASQKEKLEKQLREIHEIETKYLNTNRIGNILNEINNLKQQMIDLNNKGVEEFKFQNSQLRDIDVLLKNIENKITPQKPQLRVSQPDNYFSSFNPTYNHTLTKNYNTLSIEPLQEDNITLSKANKKLTDDYNKLQDDYNELTIDKHQLEIENKDLEKKNKQLEKNYNKKMEEAHGTYLKQLNILDNDFNDKIKNIYKIANEQIEEVKKKNKLAISKETEFEINNKKLSDVDIQTTSPTLAYKDIQTDTAKQSNKDIQTALPSLYITDFRETYNQQGDYNKKVEAIQENANRKVEAIKKIYKQTQEDLIDEYNYLANQLREEYKNKKIRQNEYFEIPGKEQPEDNNTTNKLVLTNNKVMADINPTFPHTVLHEKITPPPEATGKEEEDKPDDKPEEEEKKEEQATKDIVDDKPIEEEEDEKLEEDKPEEDKPEEDKPKEEEKKMIPIEKVGDVLSKVIDSFYIQDKPIEETFGKLEETINNIPDEVFYKMEPYIASALANITVDGQKVFKDEAEVQQLLFKIKNPNKIHKRYKLPKELDKALTQSNQRHLTISPMLLRNRKQININKNIYQY